MLSGNIVLHSEWSVTMSFISFLFFNDTATTEIYTLSLHDALPISIDEKLEDEEGGRARRPEREQNGQPLSGSAALRDRKSTTSELQSRQYLVCRLLLEKNRFSRRSHRPRFTQYTFEI